MVSFDTEEKLYILISGVYYNLIKQRQKDFVEICIQNDTFDRCNCLLQTHYTSIRNFCIFMDWFDCTNETYNELIQKYCKSCKDKQYHKFDLYDIAHSEMHLISAQKNACKRLCNDNEGLTLLLFLYMIIYLHQNNIALFEKLKVCTSKPTNLIGCLYDNLCLNTQYYDIRNSIEYLEKNETCKEMLKDCLDKDDLHGTFDTLIEILYVFCDVLDMLKILGIIECTNPRLCFKYILTYLKDI